MKLKYAARLLPLVITKLNRLRFPTLTHLHLKTKPLATAIATNDFHISDSFIERVQTCFAHAAELECKENKTIWEFHESQNKDFIEALLSKSPDRVRPFVNNLYGGTLMSGMAHTQSFVVGRKTTYPGFYFSVRVKDALLSLGEAIGILSPTSNQQTNWNEYFDYLDQDYEKLIEKIENALGYSIETPLIGNPPVAVIGNKMYNPDTIRHAYMTVLFSRLEIPKASSIIEIGGGYGCVARFAQLSGFESWTIIDLPYVNAIQMLWLGATVGPENVSGIGEEPSKIHIIPNSCKKFLSDNQFNLALNMDSLPEIPNMEAAEYLAHVSSNANFFISVNQEAKNKPRGGTTQNSVSEMMSKYPMKLVSRHPYWMEQGYIEEVYKKTDKIC